MADSPPAEKGRVREGPQIGTLARIGAEVRMSLAARLFLRGVEHLGHAGLLAHAAPFTTRAFAGPFTRRLVAGLDRSIRRVARFRSGVAIWTRRNGGGRHQRRKQQHCTGQLHLQLGSHGTGTVLIVAPV